MKIGKHPQEKDLECKNDEESMNKVTYNRNYQKKAWTKLRNQKLPEALQPLQSSPVLYASPFPQYPVFEQKCSQTPLELIRVPPSCEPPALQVLQLAGHAT